MKKQICVVMVLLGCFLAITTNAADKNAKQDNKPAENLLKTEIDKFSYVIGTQMGQNFKKQGIEINVEPLIQGLRDVMKDKQLLLTQDQMQQVMMDFQKRKQAQQMQRQNEGSAKNLAEGKAFLEKNKKNKGVIELPSGLQYKIIKKGTGKIPAATSRVKTHYRGTLIDGTEFDSSYKRNAPAEFAVRGVIKGWTEALQLMKVGAKWELYIPADLAYGERGRPSIPANSTLIFEIELLEVK